MSLQTDSTIDEGAAFELRVLDPQQVKIFRVAGVVRLTLENNRSWTRAQPMRAFPLSNPDQYIGFLDVQNKDIGIITNPALLDAESRKIMEEELEKRYFVPLIRKVLSVKEEFGTVTWKVETDRGQRDIMVRNIRDNLQELSASRIIVTDVDGNRYEFPDISRIDGRSQGIILRNL